MGNSDWNTLGEPDKRGMSTWGKVLMGCGIAFLVLLAGCVGFSLWVAKGSGKEYIIGKVNKALEKPWSRMVAVTTAIQTDEGALELYRDNPLLKSDFPTEDDFLAKAVVWRTKVSDLSSTPPTFTELDKNDLQINSQRMVGGVKVFEIGYRLPDNSRIRLRWEDDKLAEINVR